MEYLDVVNEKDEVVGKASRPDIYHNQLRHRIVHVFVFNDEGKLALQLRSKKCSFCPLHWVTSVGGHVQSGETYAEAAIRESEEELGFRPDIELIGNFLYVDKTHNVGLKKFLGVFKAKHPGPFTIDEEAVEKVEYFSRDEIKKMIDKGEKFHPELLFLLQEGIWQ